jgi:hypothetical protein
MTEAIELRLSRLRQREPQAAERFAYAMEEATPDYLTNGPASGNVPSRNSAPIGIVNDLSKTLASLMEPPNPTGPAPSGHRSQGIYRLCKLIVSKVESDEMKQKKRQRKEQRLSDSLKPLETLRDDLDVAFNGIEAKALDRFQFKLHENWKTTANQRSRARQDSTA